MSKIRMMLAVASALLHAKTKLFDPLEFFHRKKTEYKGSIERISKAEKKRMRRAERNLRNKQ